MSTKRQTCVIYPHVSASSRSSNNISTTSSTQHSQKLSANSDKQSDQTTSSQASHTSTSSVNVSSPCRAFSSGNRAMIHPPLRSMTRVTSQLRGLPRFTNVHFTALANQSGSSIGARIVTSFTDNRAPVLISAAIVRMNISIGRTDYVIVFSTSQCNLSRLRRLHNHINHNNAGS